MENFHIFQIIFDLVQNVQNNVKFGCELHRVLLSALVPKHAQKDNKTYYNPSMSQRPYV